ncbi:MAG: UDP-N-acetylglucosamine 2-epimerase (non-hydrolyzing) [Nitrosomonadales bacterium]|nr:UDP-N-acetylglucosamine 2-epimerase (non-hydrolyzing) [Nitrosomonadales bacterium]
MRKILAVIGNRSAAIRIAPLIRLLQKVPSMQTVVCIASPHVQHIARDLDVFGIKVDEEVCKGACQPIMEISQDIDVCIRKHKPDCVLVQGDAGAMMESFRRHAAYGNLGSGLRMYELHHHSEEGANPQVIDLVDTHYFVSSEISRDRLLKEGVAAENIYVTDSPAVDALLIVAERISSDEGLKAGLAAAFPSIDPGKRLILVAGYRRDYPIGRLENICRALKRLAMRADVQVIYPAHPEPRMRRIADEVFADHPGITVIEQQDYLHHVYLMQTAYLILADSDDVQDEILSLGKPVLVMRDVNERPESDDVGTIKLVGTDSEHILRECSMFLDDESYYQAFASHRNPYGDGQASQRIVETMLR